MDFEVVAEGLKFPEGPIAMADGSVVLVEIQRQTLTRVKPDGSNEVIAHLGGGPMYAAIAHTGAWINLFNLLTVWQLDGNRGFAALSTSQRWLIVLTFVVGWVLTHDGLFVLLIAAAALRSFDAEAPVAGDRGAVAQFAFLILALAALLRAAA